MKKVTLFLLTAILIGLPNFETHSKPTEIQINKGKSLEKLKVKAKEAYKRKDYNKAKNYYKKLVKFYPNNYDYRGKYAVSLYKTKKYSKAKEEFINIAKNSGNKKFIAYSIKMVKDIQEIEKKTPKKELIKKKYLGKVVNIKNSEDNYLCENNTNIHKDGSFYRWEKDEMPLRVYIPIPSEKFKIKNYREYPSYVKSSLNKWSKMTNGLIKYNFVTHERDANLIIKWINHFDKTDGAWGKAYKPHYLKDLKRKASIVNLAVKAQPGSARYTDDAAPFSKEELISIIVHELGHSFGLGHTSNKNDIMTYSYKSDFYSLQAKITQRDINTIKKLYSLPKNSRVKCVQ